MAEEVVADGEDFDVSLLDGTFWEVIDQRCLDFEFTTNCVIAGILFVFGCVGNSLSIYTLWEESKTNISACLLTSLSLSDIGILVLTFLVKGIPSACRYFSIGRYFMDIMYSYIFSFVWPLRLICHMISVWTIVHLTYQRYLSMSH